jgi:hypothetical protein
MSVERTAQPRTMVPPGPAERWYDTPDGPVLNSECSLEVFRAAWRLARKRGDEQAVAEINFDANRFHRVQFLARKRPTR